MKAKTGVLLAGAGVLSYFLFFGAKNENKQVVGGGGSGGGSIFALPTGFASGGNSDTPITYNLPAVSINESSLNTPLMTDTKKATSSNNLNAVSTKEGTGFFNSSGKLVGVQDLPTASNPRSRLPTVFEKSTNTPLTKKQSSISLVSQNQGVKPNSPIAKVSSAIKSLFSRKNK